MRPSLGYLGSQTKLHQWANDDPDRRFDDLYNLVYDPAFLVVAWNRVRGNRGARSAGVDGVQPRSIVFGAGRLLPGLRDELKARTFQPLPVRERMIPKAGGKLRRLGIATARDRVVQASLKLVLEPIFEADFKPVSYGFRTRRRARPDAIAEIHHYASRSYEWVAEGDITACFDEISHVGLQDRLRRRIGDKRVLGLVKAFLKAGILSEDGVTRDTITGTPQGGILSPLLSNVALSVLDEHFVKAWQEMGEYHKRARRRAKGLATYRLVRYADDWVSGTREHAEGLRSHYGFDSFYCTPGIEGAHEKGGVEGEVGRFRCRHLVPVPVVADMAELNALLAAGDVIDDERHIARRADTVGEAAAAELPSLSPLPAVAFDPCACSTPRSTPRAASACARVSAPCLWAWPAGRCRCAWAPRRSR
jgi:group II intron reverse transcriptase/maturase